MNADDLKSAMKEVGFPDKAIQTLPLVDAKKAFIIAVNDLVPEGSEEDPGLSDHVLKVYNNIDKDEITDWPGPVPIKSKELTGLQQYNLKQKAGKEERLKQKAAAKAQKEADKAAAKEAAKRPVGKPLGTRKTKKKTIEDHPTTHTQLRGSAVAYSRITACIEALRVGGIRLDIMKRADRLYMAHGGGSNLHETELAFMLALRVLRVLKLITEGGTPKTYKLKKFHEYKSASSNN